MTPETPWIPWEISPDPAPDLDWEGAESVEFVDLREFPPGYIIRALGEVPYILLPEVVDGQKTVRIWLNPHYGSIVGPIDNIVNHALSGIKTGVIATEGFYTMPYFRYFDGGRTEINYFEGRVSRFREISIQKLPA